MKNETLDRIRARNRQAISAIRARNQRALVALVGRPIPAPASITPASDRRIR